jgi:hypothetical protein
MNATTKTMTEVKPREWYLRETGALVQCKNKQYVKVSLVAYPCEQSLPDGSGKKWPCPNQIHVRERRRNF